jgi:cytochrome c oxidase subunit 2
MKRDHPREKRLQVNVRMIRAIPLLILGSILMRAVGCTPDHLMSTFDPVGPVAAEQKKVWDYVFWAMAFVFVTLLPVLLYMSIKFRRKDGDPIPPQIHGNRNLEILWTILPIIILAVVAVPTLNVLKYVLEPPSGSMQVNVTGHQWWWEFEYPELELRTANELYIPIGKPVQFNLQSKDVIHSFWVPKLGGKMDAIPTRTNVMWYQADVASPPEGFYGQCMEFCGTSHANMKFRVHAVDAGAFDEWVQGQKEPGPATEELSELAAQGKDHFENLDFTATYADGTVTKQRCAYCHTVEGLSISGARTGPNLTHLASRKMLLSAIVENNADNLSGWLNNPQAMKPGVLMPNPTLSVEQTTALVEYLQSLK